MKTYIATKTAAFTIKAIRDLFIETMQQMSSAKRTKCIEHVITKIEPQMWSLDGIVDCLVEPLIINLQDYAESDDDDIFYL